jgi:hypothetical protein
MFVQNPQNLLIMYPARVLSIHKGWGLLTGQKPDEWQDIQNALLAFTQDKIGNLSSLIPAIVSNKELKNERYIPLLMPYLWGNLLKAHGWQDTTVKSKTGVSREVTFNNVKNQVIASLLSAGADERQLSNWIFVTSPRAQELGVSDIIILLIPSDDLLEIINYVPEEGEAITSHLFTESDARAQIHELLAIDAKYPIVFIFFSQHEQELSIEELPVFQQYSNSVERAIEFPPEYYQAGVTVLANFGEVLRDKYPNINAKVRIEQEGNIVRMHVGLPNGEVETVEEVLEKYFLVVSKQAPAELLFESRLKVAKLENKLDLIDAELRSSERALKLSIESREDMKAAHEQAVAGFQHIIGEQAAQIHTLIHLATQQVTSHERTQLAQSTLFKDLIGENNGNHATLMAIRSLEYNLMSVQDQISSALTTIKNEKPSLLNHLAAQVESASFGSVGGYVLDWISKHSI